MYTGEHGQLRPGSKSRAERVRELNARFRRSPLEPGAWSSGGGLADAGLLIHVYDGWESDHSRPWVFSGDVSCSLVYAENPYATTFNGGNRGVIYRPGTLVKCGKVRRSNFACICDT